MSKERTSTGPTKSYLNLENPKNLTLLNLGEKVQTPLTSRRKEWFETLSHTTLDYLNPYSCPIDGTFTDRVRSFPPSCSFDREGP